MSHKRSRKVPDRFEPWQEGEKHAPMALRKENQKQKVLKEKQKVYQKEYREKKKVEKQAKVEESKKENQIKEKKWRKLFDLILNLYFVQNKVFQVFSNQGYLIFQSYNAIYKEKGKYLV